MTHRNSFSASDEAYTATAIGLHWLIAALMVCGFSLGWVMTSIHGFTPAKLRYVSWHKWIGVTVFALATLRILWRATHRAPPLPPGMPAWQRAGANLVHVLLYVLMIAIPITGYLFSSASNVPVVYLGIVPLPRLIAPDKALKAVFETAHLVLNWSLAALVLAHVGAALKHQWIDRDGLLARMIPFLKTKQKKLDLRQLQEK
ncbi:cytochrome b [Trinickia dinghuensis]|uniref:Cytochrome b n=1 Tax=Trinickia dinghuensis TaxID=2291023 RepID=A0A3D8JPG7_9BURK|nr:cytochrome b [Trinickia dinghuensis]RDU94999.1 cytochrome b [Trinickia dinghuensis]